MRVPVVFTLCLCTLGVSIAQAQVNVAARKPYKASVQASSTYPDTGGIELTNGVYAPSADYYHAAWQGRTSTSYYHTIDLGSNQSVNKILTNFMVNATAGISYPTSVTCSYSRDGLSFTSLGNAIGQTAIGNRKKYQWTGTAVTARYIRVTVKGSGSWIFQDEIEVWSPSTGTAPKNLAYPQTNITATVGSAITLNKPTVVGTVTSWKISPALPAGLSFSTSNGAIFGTPSTAQAATTYTVTAGNAYGNTSATLSITVNSAIAGIPAPLHGVSLDDGWDDTPTNRAAIIAALQACPVKPTVRIVMDKTQTPGNYASLFQAVHNVAYVMACPVDSDYMLSYQTVAAYRQRFVDSVAALEPYVDLWEIGNEINGEGPNTGQGTSSDPAWMGNGATARQFNADKMYAAYSYIHGLGLKTVLTPYGFAPECGYNESTPTMEAWLNTYVPADMKAGIDYVMVSYYEDDNDGYQPNWQTIFNTLQTIFPTAKLGFGECGNTSESATTQSKIDMVHLYYQKPKYVANYVGGYFWWSWAQDCVLDSGAATIRSIMYTDMLAQPQ